MSPEATILTRMDGKTDRLRLTRPGEANARGERARLYVRWMPHLGAGAVALYELLRILPEIGQDDISHEELAELLKSDADGVRDSLRALLEAGFVVERDGWSEVSAHPPAGGAGETKVREESSRPTPRSRPASGEGSGAETPEFDGREIELVKPEPEGVSADDYFRYMGNLPAPHIIEFLNNYSVRDGVEPDVVREALRIASERDARRVGYVRSIMERWVERGVKTLDDVRLFEEDRKLRLVEQSGARGTPGGASNIGKGVGNGTHRQPAARREEGYEWLFGQQEER